MDLNKCSDNTNIGEYNLSLVIYGQSLVIYGQSLVIYGQSLVIYGQSLVIYGQSLVIYGQSLVIYGQSQACTLIPNLRFFLTNINCISQKYHTRNAHRLLSHTSNNFNTNNYSKTCRKRPLRKKTKNGFNDQLSLTAGQKNCRRAFCNTFDHHQASYHLSIRPLFCLF